MVVELIDKLLSKFFLATTVREFATWIYNFVNNHLSLAAAATSFWENGFIILHCFKATWLKEQWISVREINSIDRDLSR